MDDTGKVLVLRGENDQALVQAKPDLSRFVDQFLEGRTPRTLEAYRRDLEDFQAFVDGDSLAGAAWALVGHGPGNANSLVLDYRTALAEKGLSPATINRRLAALRSIVKQAALVGLEDARGLPVGWRLEVKGLKSRAYRDTRGPGTDNYRRLLAYAAEWKPPGRRTTKPATPAEAARNVAILRLLYDRGLRRGELVALDQEDLDLGNKRVQILGKGRTEKEWLTLAGKTCEALADWLAHRGEEPGPLFVNFDRCLEAKGRPLTASGKAQRLSGRGLARLVEGLALGAGIGDVSPHGLRHSAITAALEKTNGNVAAVKRFSRHVDLNTLMKYDDNRTDVGGDITELLAD